MSEVNRTPEGQDRYKGLVRILDQGVAAWNAWRETNPDVEVDLAGIQLKGASLAGINLSGVFLWDAHLENVDLSKASLVNAQAGDATFAGANLREANLDSHPEARDDGYWGPGTDLEEANFQGADLSDASLRGVDLTGTSFRNANLERACLCGVFTYPSVYLGNANLRGADLRNACLWKAQVYDANLESADLRGAYLKGANLSGANLRGCDLRRIILSRSIFSNADMTGARWTPTARLPYIGPIGLQLARFAAAGQFKVRVGDSVIYRTRRGKNEPEVVARITRNGKSRRRFDWIESTGNYRIELSNGEVIPPHLIAFD